MTSGRPLIIGVGNRFRGDDAIGPFVLDALRQLSDLDADFLNWNADPAVILEGWHDTDVVILIDACQSGSKPGTLHTIDVAAQSVLPEPPARSTHGLTVAQTIEMAEALGRLPKHLIIFCIEGAQFDFGAPLSPAVAEAIPKLVKRIKAEIECIAPVARRGEKPSKG